MNTNPLRLFAEPGRSIRRAGSWRRVAAREQHWAARETAAAPPRGLQQRGRFSLSVLFVLTGFLALGLVVAAAPAADLAAGFEQANRLYERGEYTLAADAYQGLLDQDPGNATLLFNLGNAWFKDNRLGKAIAAYRRAQKSLPRDPDIRFNLGFARQQATGDDAVPGSFWSNALSRLTLNEWTILTAAAFWVLLGLLAARETRPKLAAVLKNYTLAAGVGAGISGVCLLLSAREHFTTRHAVVTVQEAIVRYGPLQESQINFTLQDGAEVTILDHKAALGSGLPERWLQVEDATGRLGWLRESQVDSLN